MSAAPAVSFDLGPLMRPASVAVVGASDTPGRFGYRVMKNLETWGFAGAVYPVNPGRREVLGLPCYPGLRDLPAPADTAVIAVPREHVLGVLEDAVAGGVRSAVVFTSGFADAGPAGAALQADLVRLARQAGLPVCGPNCMGIINWWARSALYSGDMSAAPPAGHVGVLSQSGSVAMALVASGRPLGLSCAVSSGNEAVLTAEDYIDFMIDDPDIRAIACFLEQVRNPERFAQLAARALAVGKPMVALKVGASEKGREAAAAHTSALAGSDRVLDAFFRQHGVVRVRDLDELLAAAQVLASCPEPAGRGLGGLAVSGGEIALMLDLAQDLGLEFPPLAPETRQTFAGLHPLFAPRTNPVDVWGVGAAGAEDYRRFLEILAADPGVHTLLLCHDAPPHRSAALHMAEAAAQTAGAMGKPVVFITGPAGYRSPEVRARLEQAGIPFLEGARPGLRAVQALEEFAAARRSRTDAAEPGAAETIAGADQVRDLLDRVRGPLNEAEGYQLLAACGIPVARHRVAADMAAAQSAAAGVGYPVVLKALSRDLAHKSELGGVALNLKSPLEVAAAYEQMMAGLAERAPDAAIEGVLVQQMVSGGTECIVGTTRDAQFGQALLFGLGGVLVEVFQDTALRVLPVRRADAEAMIREVRGYRLLTGVRGRPPADVGALADALTRLAALVRAFPQLQLEINPLLVLPEGQGVRAVDVLARVD